MTTRSSGTGRYEALFDKIMRLLQRETPDPQSAVEMLRGIIYAIEGVHKLGDQK